MSEKIKAPRVGGAKLQCTSVMAVLRVSMCRFTVFSLVLRSFRFVSIAVLLSGIVAKWVITPLLNKFTSF